MISKINYKKIIIISTIFIGLFFLLFYFSHNTVSEENNQQTNANDTEMFRSVSVEPNKIKVGETQITRVEIDSKERIEKVFAQIPFEGGYDEVALYLVAGDNKKGVWEGEWVAHNTLSKQYETKISVVVSSGEIKTINATWWDDTETTWFDQNWIQRKKVTVTENSGTDLTDYQVPIDLTTGIYDNTGLVGSWHFSEGSGTFVADSSGQGNNGTIYNGEIWAANNKGESNSALNFDGSGNYIKIENSNSSNHSLDLLQNFTFISWIKPASLSTYNAIIAKRNGGSYQYELRLDSGYISLLTSSGVIKSDLLVDTGRWHFIAAVRDVVSGITTIFLDGHSYSAANLGISYCNTNVTMGKNADGTHIFNGSVDEVRIYNRALSAEEIGQLYGEGKARLDLNDLRFTSADGKTQLSFWLENDSKAWVKIPTLSANADTNVYYYFGNKSASAASSASGTFIREISGLAGAWGFNEGSGTMAYDSSGNNNAGTLTNNPVWTTDKYGNSNSALSLDGADDYVITPSIDLTGTNKVTLSMIFKPATAVSGSIKILAEFSPNFNDVDDGFIVDYSENNNSISAALRGNNYNNYSNRNSVTQVVPGNWYYVTAVFDKSLSAEEAKLYVNGVSEGTYYWNADNTNYFGNRQLYLGARGGSSYFADATIDEVRLYNTVLTADEISDIYNNATYSVSNYPGKTLVYKYVSSGPTYSVSSQEEKRPTDAGASGVSGGGPLAF